MVEECSWLNLWIATIGNSFNFGNLKRQSVQNGPECLSESDFKFLCVHFFSSVDLDRCRGPMTTISRKSAMNISAMIYSYMIWTKGFRSNVSFLQCGATGRQSLANVAGETYVGNSPATYASTFATKYAADIYGFDPAIADDLYILKVSVWANPACSP